MSKMTDQIVQLALAGASIEIDAATKMTPQLIQIANALHPDATLRLYNSSVKMTAQLMQVVSSARPGQVIIVL